jgi:putative endonuclease
LARFLGLSTLLARVRAAWQRHQALDRRGERAAERFVRRLGYKIVARRQRSRLGELDLVAVDGRTVVFIEVKTRRSHDAGHPAEAVGPEKQQKLTRLALAYLKRHDLLEHSARFDVLAVTWPDSARKPKIEHYQNAFPAVGRGQMFS